MKQRSALSTCGLAHRCASRATSAGCSRSAGSNRIQSDVLNPQDLQRLIDMITEEVIAAQRSAIQTACACHAVRSDCCPDRLQSVVAAGATRLGLHATAG